MKRTRAKQREPEHYRRRAAVWHAVVIARRRARRDAELDAFVVVVAVRIKPKPESDAVLIIVRRIDVIDEKRSQKGPLILVEVHDKVVRGRRTPIGVRP